MQHTILIVVDHKKALLSGADEYGRIEAPLPLEQLSDAERAILADCPLAAVGDHIKGDIRTYIDPYKYDDYGLKITLKDLLKPNDTSLESIRAVLADRARVVKNIRDENKKKYEAALRKIKDATDDDLMRKWSTTSKTLSSSWLNLHKSQDLEGVHNNPEVAERLAGIHEKCLQKQSEIREWALKNGSERLRLMLELEAGDWLAFAHAEYACSVAPEGYELASKCVHKSNREMPSLAELKELARLRALCGQPGSMLANASILHAKDFDDSDFDVFYVVLASVAVCVPGFEPLYFEKVMYKHQGTKK